MAASRGARACAAPGSRPPWRCPVVCDCPTEGWAPTAPARIGTRTSDATSYGLSAAAAVLGVVARRCMAARRGSTVGTWDSQVRVSRWSTNGVPRTVIVGDVVVTLPPATTVPPRRPARAHSVPVRAPQGQQAAAPRSADGTRACMHWGSGQIERRHWVADAVVAFRIKSPTSAISWSGSWTHVPPQRSGRSKLRLSASLLVKCALARPEESPGQNRNPDPPRPGGRGDRRRCAGHRAAPRPAARLAPGVGTSAASAAPDPAPR